MSDVIRTNGSGERAESRPGGLACHVVKDLLPLYADRLTGEQTSRDIKEHLLGCEDCSREYRAMTGESGSEPKAEGEGPGGESFAEPSGRVDPAQAEKEIDYLKKVRKRSKLPAVIVGCVALLAIAILIVRIYVVGKDEPWYVSMSGSVNGKEVNIESITPVYSDLAISGISFSEQNGVVTVNVRTVPVLFFQSSEKSASYTAQQDVKTLQRADGLVLWTDNVKVDTYTAEVFKARTKYIGNNSAVADLIKTVNKKYLLGIPDNMELQTKTEPYGLKLYDNDSMVTCTEEEKTRMISYWQKHSCVFLACVDNLGYVEFEYKDLNGQPLNFKFTLEDANRLIGQNLATYGVSDIKGFGQSAGKLQHLMNILGL